MIHVRGQRAAAAALAAVAVTAAVAGCAATGSGSVHAGGQPTATGSLAATGQPTGTAGATVVVRDPSSGRTVSLAVGQRLELILASNYWTVHGSSVPGVLRQDGKSADLAPPAGCGHIPGVGCIPIRTDFTALTAGTAVITATRLSCGEAMLCAQNARHFTLTVVVR